MPAKGKQFILYKIYSENCLLYLGRTKQPLNTRLRGHFFKTPMMREINIEAVTKIEYAVFSTEADMNVMEVYFINKLKPVLNRDDKAKDELTIRLEEPVFQEYHCPHMDKWREQIRAADAADEEKRKLKTQLEKEKWDKHKEIFNCSELSLEEKRERWWTWLETVYEPTRNGLL